jgi:hypothetical protein
MTDSSCTPKRLPLPSVAALPDPELQRISSPSHGEIGAALPRPVSMLPNIADSGRICFGAGFRLPINK